jgi:hypothetical protein
VWLKADGISIPSSCNSYIAPIATSKLWMGANEFVRNTNVGLETAFVVLFHNCYQFTEAKKLFTFSHPNHLSPGGGTIDNNR